MNSPGEGGFASAGANPIELFKFQPLIRLLEGEFGFFGSFQGFLLLKNRYAVRQHPDRHNPINSPLPAKQRELVKPRAGNPRYPYFVLFDKSAEKNSGLGFAKELKVLAGGPHRGHTQPFFAVMKRDGDIVGEHPVIQPGRTRKYANKSDYGITPIDKKIIPDPEQLQGLFPGKPARQG